MSLSVTNVGDNPQQPSANGALFVPDQLIAGNLKLVTETVTITGGVDLVRGSVLGQITVGTATSAVKASGANTGTGTFVLDATTPVLAGAKVGVYTLRCITAAANGGVFRLEDPDGFVVGDYTITGGAGGTVTVNDDIKGVITDAGTDFIVGDGFDITVAAGSGKYKLAASASTDGSQTPVAILCDTAAASGGDVLAGIYVMGEFNSRAVTLGTGITLAVAKAALRLRSIFLKDTVSASDPT